MCALFRIVWRAGLASLLLLFLFGSLLILYIQSTLPSVEILKDIRLQIPLKVFTQDGQLIAEFGEGRRSPIRLEQIPPLLIKAVLATEDRRFYEHAGVDIRGLLRSSAGLLTTFSKKQGGGSTITMQIARNFFLSRKITFARKIAEILLALQIEKQLTKDEILSLYLNKIYFGKRAYGIAAAADVYYGTTVENLTLDQIAMLAGLPQAPSSINPIHNPQAAYKRRKHVLERMLTYEFISKEQFEQAIDKPLPTKSQGHTSVVEAPYVAEMVRQALLLRYGESIYESGYNAYTTLDSRQQIAANRALKRALLEYDQRHGYRKPVVKLQISAHKTIEQELAQWNEALQEIPSYGGLLPGVVMRIEETHIAVLLQDGRYIDIPWKGLSWAKPALKGYRLGPAPQKPADIVGVGSVIYTQQESPDTWKIAQIPEVGGALVALDPKNGKILALVGGFDYSLSAFNRAIQAERLPGSNFKPFVYAAALNEGYTLASIINDAPVIYTDPSTDVTWRPQNDTKKFYGPTRLRLSLMRSQNMVTIRLLRAIGVHQFIEFVQRFGFKPEKLPPYLSLALGTAQVTPLEMAAGYCVFANGGYRIEPHFLDRVTGDQGQLIYQSPVAVPVAVLDPRIAFLVTSALQDAIQGGTGQRAKGLGRKDLAGKTGTTNSWVDAWYSGYNPTLVATAWMGFNDSRSLKEYGSMAALPMWMYFMEEALKNKPDRPFLPPPGIVRIKIDPQTGLAASEGQKGTMDEFFTSETVPNTQKIRSKNPALENDTIRDHEENGDLPPGELLF